MTAHFLTRDILLDYPQIGWFPPLPPGADDLWGQFSKGNFHCGDYPELLVAAKGGAWSLYLGAIPSTRTDSPGGGGRIIRTSCFLQGDASEAGLIGGALSSYVMNVLLGECHEGDGSLASVLDAAIREGTPREWTRMQFEERAKAAQALMEKMLKAKPPFPVGVSSSDLRDIPFSVSGAKDFAGECMALIAGKENGMAVSLANLVPAERERAFDCIAARPDRLTVFYTAGDADPCIGRKETLEGGGGCRGRSVGARKAEFDESRRTNADRRGGFCRGDIMWRCHKSQSRLPYRDVGGNGLFDRRICRWRAGFGENEKEQRRQT